MSSFKFMFFQIPTKISQTREHYLLYYFILWAIPYLWLYISGANNIIFQSIALLHMYLQCNLPMNEGKFAMKCMHFVVMWTFIFNHMITQLNCMYGYTGCRTHSYLISQWRMHTHFLQQVAQRRMPTSSTR